MPQSPVLTIPYKKAGDHQIKLDLYRPAADRPIPAVVWVHGGALIMGSRRGILGRSGLLDMCLQKGFAVVAIDYRLAPETKLPEIVGDLRDAFAWVQRDGRHHGIDTRRVGVMGHSAGGYLALMSGFAVQPRPSALVSFYGYGDIAADWYARPDDFYNQQPPVPEAEAWGATGMVQVSDPDDETSARRQRFYLWTRQRGRWPQEVAGLDPAKDRTSLGPWCPALNVDPLWPPTLLLHGTTDTDVPYDQSVQMLLALSASKRDHRLVTLPGAPHGFDRGITLDDLSAPRPSTIARACIDAVEFLCKHT